MNMWLIIMVVPALVLSIGEWLGPAPLHERLHKMEQVESCVEVQHYATAQHTWNETAVRERCRRRIG